MAKALLKFPGHLALLLPRPIDRFLSVAAVYLLDVSLLTTFNDHVMTLRVVQSFLPGLWIVFSFIPIINLQ